MSMKHCCHCHIDEQIKKFKAGKLGLLGGILIVGHLLFHVAECLVIPAVIAGFSRHSVEAIEELDEKELSETAQASSIDYQEDLANLRRSLFDSIQQNYPLKR